MKCPRCGNGIPNNEQESEYPGALSRVDNETEICSQCGLNEAIYQFAFPGMALTPVNKPVWWVAENFLRWAKP